jgi:hypothetical protein
MKQTMKLGLALSLSMVASACSKDVVLLSERTVTSIGTSGGRAVSAGGEMSLDFEAGALTAEQEITIETNRARQVPRQKSLIYELGPDGLAFQRAVTITIRAPAAEADEELAIANVDGAYPEVLDTSVWDRERGELSAVLEHFSSYAVVSVYNPCAAHACGEGCTICDPLDPICTEPAPAAKACNRSGLCVEETSAICPEPMDAGSMEDAGPSADGGEIDAGDIDAGDSDAAVVPFACTDSLEQNPQPIVDILVVMDSSCSMSEEQANLGSSFNLLLDTLVDNNVDFHIGVTSMDVDLGGDQGALVGVPKVLTSTTPNLPQAFADNVLLGTGGSGIEQGLEASRLALSPPLVSGVNAGFLRDSGSLTVIYVSDEIDQSPSSTTAYAQFLVGLRGPRRVQANAIVGDVPGGCSGSNGVADSGERYDQVRAATGGAFDSICMVGWNIALTDLGGPGFGYLHEVQMTNPLTGNLEVRVDGVLVPQVGTGGEVNWTYDASTNRVIFSETAVPPPSATITIDYDC